MPLTYTNRVVYEGGTDYPGLVDIAVGLSRQPRFAGQGRRWWSVLDHSLFCDELLQAATPYTSHGQSAGLRCWRLGLLLHDAHECLTADIPTPFKSDAIRALQRALDVRIMDAYFPGGIERYDKWHREIEAIDQRALRAEAQVIGQPVDRARILDLFGEDEETDKDVEVLNGLLWGKGSGWLSIPPHFSDQHKHPGPVEYMRRVVELL